MILHNFVVLEGGDGTGTSTQLQILRARLGSILPPDRFHVTFEPGDGPIGKLIRSALCGQTRLCPETNARLFAADRNEHLYASNGVAERCGRGELVISDRYVLSSLVYQGLDCPEGLPLALNRDFPKPELLLFFDVDPEIAEKRFSGREIKDLYEKLDFQKKVRGRYLNLVEEYCAGETRLVRIDAGKSIEEVAKEVWSAIETLPILKR